MSVRDHGEQPGGPQGEREARAAAWPQGEGEMARLIRAHDWGRTPLGVVESWPASLRSAVDLALALPLGMIVLWGPQLVQVYNDGYRQVMGAKHPEGLGQPTRACWPEVWPFNAPVYETVLKGEARSFSDQKLVIERHGRPEPAWFDLAYSPLRDDAGAVAGVLVTVVKTTAKVRSEAMLRAREEAVLRESEERFRALVTASSDVVYRMSPDWSQMRELDGRGFLMNVAEPTETWMDRYIDPDDQPVVKTAIEQAIGTKSMFALEHRVRQADGGLGWTFSRAIPILDEGGEIKEWLGAASDVTARKEAELALRESEARHRLIVEGVRDYAIFTTDADGVISSWPPGAQGVLGWSAAEAVGQPFGMTFTPEDRAKGEPEKELTQARETGSAPNIRWHQRKDGGRVFIEGRNLAMRAPDGETRGFLKIGQDVTEREREREALRESEARFRLMADAVPQIVWITDPEGRVEFFNQQWVNYMGAPRDPITAAEVAGSAVHPEDAAATMEAFDAARASGGVFEVEHRIRGKNGGYRWFLVRAEPYRDPATGEILRWFGASTDIHDRKLAEARLRESEERFRSFADNSADTLWIADAQTGQLEYLSPAFEAMWGETRERVMQDVVRWSEIVHPEDRARAAEGMPRLLKGETHQQTYRILRPSDRAMRFIQDTGFPIRDAQGQVRRVAGIAQDVTEQRSLEAARTESERRLRVLMEGIPQLVWRSGDMGRRTWASAQWIEFTGLSQGESQGRGWLDAVHPDDRGAAVAAWEEAQARGILDVEYRIRRAEDGVFVWHHTRALPVRDEEGRALEWLGTSTDIHDLRQLREAQTVLVAELQHRTRNIVAVVRSLAERTLRGSASLGDFEARFGTRMEALGRVQGLLSRSSEGQRVSFDTLIRAELDAHGALDGKARKVSLDGPKNVRLRSAHVQTLALALHELATNALKYGALHAPDGKLSVRWRVERDGKGPALAVEWRESGVALPENFAPERKGYGRELIERALPYQLRAETEYEIGPDGVRCAIRMAFEE